MNGNYSTLIFTSEAQRVIDAHDVTEPMFMYLAYQVNSIILICLRLTETSRPSITPCKPPIITSTAPTLKSKTLGVEHMLAWCVIPVSNTPVLKSLLGQSHGRRHWFDLFLRRSHSLASAGNITKTLKAKGMWKDTVVVFTTGTCISFHTHDRKTDNGGEPSSLGRGNNFPLRGTKVTNFEVS